MKTFLILYFLMLFSMLSIFASGVVDSQDGFQYLAVARNIYYKGKPTAPIYEYNTRKNVHMSTYVGKDGDTYSLTGLGYSIALVPAVAITDIVYRIYSVSPPTHFPLESDWVILMFSSFTNSFFGAFLGLVIFLYLLEVGISKRTSLCLSIISIFSTNLFVYTKYSFAQMMFTVFLVLSFFFLKKFSKNYRQTYMVLSGAAFGVMVITYNPTFVLSIVPYILYYVIITKYKFNLNTTKKALYNFFHFFIGLLPFIIIYIWFESLRAYIGGNFVTSGATVIQATSGLIHMPLGVFIEGLYGQLLSPGRSIFIYSPLLLIILLFWHKLTKVIKPELIAFLSLSGVYILFYSTQYSVGSWDQGISGLWHGESSWGPRYLVPLIPFGMVVVGFIYSKLKRLEKIYVFFPLLLIGLYVELLGVFFPYQIKYHDLQLNFHLNGTNYTVYDYGNFMPRYSPIFMMSKKLVKSFVSFPKTFDYGKFNVRFFDGIDFPFNVGPERWRSISKAGYIKFDNNAKDSVNQLSFGLINHTLADSSESASLTMTLNGYSILNPAVILSPKQRDIVKVSIDPKLVKDKDNILVINNRFDGQNDTVYDSQILGLIAFSINNTPINIESISVPYISSLGPAMTKISYINYGGENQDSWLPWNIHTQVYERVPDFWWVKQLYYWDIPKSFVLILFTVNILSVCFFVIKVINYKRFKW